MAFVQSQNGILMNSRYAGKYRFFTGKNDDNGHATSSTPHIVPVTVSILFSQSLFLGNYYSPAATLILPFFRTEVPYGYMFIFFMQAVTGLLVKWAFTPSPLYMPLLGNYQSLPDFESLKTISNLSQNHGNARLNLETKGTKRTLNLNNRNSNNQDQFPSDPLLPEGISINLSFISPFSEPTSRAASLYSIKLTLIKTNRGYIISILTLIIYIILKPFLGNNNNKNK